MKVVKGLLRCDSYTGSNLCVVNTKDGYREVEDELAEEFKDAMIDCLK